TTTSARSSGRIKGDDSSRARGFGPARGPARTVPRAHARASATLKSCGMRQAAGAGAPMILAEGVEKSFGSTVALAGVDIAVDPGTVLAVLGRNGAGKTTFVR